MVKLKQQEQPAENPRLMDIVHVLPRNSADEAEIWLCQEALHLSETEEVLRCNDALDMYAGELLVF